MSVYGRTTLLQAVGLGALAGMRSLSTPAILSRYLAHLPDGSSSPAPLNYLAKSQIANGLVVPAFAEMVVDKLPMTPARTATTSVVGRMGSGALAAAAVYRLRGGNILIGLVIGALAALLSTYALYYARRELGKQLDVPDPILGALEDALVVAGAFALFAGNTSRPIVRHPHSYAESDTQ